MNQVIVFAGTTEGRRLCEYFIKRKQPVIICVATEYGEIVLPEHKVLNVKVGRMDVKQMELFMKEKQCKLVIDATHPYAVEVTKNIKKAALACGCVYERVLRDAYEEQDSKPEGVVFVDSLEDAVQYLGEVEGNALITTGSKVLEPYTRIKNYEERLTFRMLPTVEAMEACVSYGIKAKKVIGMQGPFSEEMNYLMLKELHASYLVTKESGSIGGFFEKMAATARAGAVLVVIRRPDSEPGRTVEQMMQYLDHKDGEKE